MRVLVLGGIRSGKSALAEAMLAGAPSVTYLATATALPGDAEWTARIAAHRARRPAGWDTVEVGSDPWRLHRLVATAAHPTLVDDVGNWLAADPDPALLPDAVRSCPLPLVLVSPEVGLSVVPASAAGRRFADTLGELNRALAEACDTVVLVVAGLPLWLKGGDPRTGSLGP